MKGVVFKFFESFVSDNWGEDFWDDLLDAVELETEGPFLGPGTYPDSDLFALVGEAIRRLELPLSDALTGFGRYAFPKFLDSYPGAMDGHAHPKSFLKSVDGIIHVEVRKLYPNANPPKLFYVDEAPDRLTVEYASERRLCALAKGLIEGLADTYGMRIEQDETQCMHDGHERCRFELAFERAA